MNALLDHDLAEIIRLAEAAQSAGPTEVMGYIARIRRHSIYAWEQAAIEAEATERGVRSDDDSS